MLVPVMLSPSTPSSVANSKCHQKHGIPFFISVDNNNSNIPFHHHHHRPTIHKSKKIVSKLHLAQMLSTSSLYRSLDETDIDENLEWMREYQHTFDTTAKKKHQNRNNAGSSVESSTSVLELLFPFLQHNSKRRAEDNTTMKKVGSNSTLSTFMSSEVDTIDDVTNRSILLKRMVSQTSSCSDYISDNSRLPSPKKARRGSSVGSYSDASTVSSSPSSPPIKRILFQAEDEVLHTNACSPVVMMKRHHHHHNREASSGFGWYLDEEDFNLYQHYFK